MSDINSRRGSDPMTVCANDLALGDLTLCLSDAFGIADVQRLAGADVVKLKRYWMGVVSTVGAATRYLVGVQPVADAARPFIRLAIHALTIARLQQPRLPPCFHLLSGKATARPSSFSTHVRAELCRSLGRERVAALAAGERLRGGLIPWRHEGSVPSVAFPCKPDIFDATYEPASPPPDTGG